MKSLKFKTNINCNGCVATVTPHLNQASTVKNWQVDIKDPNKILTVEGEDLSRDEVVDAVKSAGFNIEEKKGLFGKLF